MMKTEETNADIIKPQEASRLIGCSEYTIRDMARRKKVPHYRVGSLIMFRRSALLRWIEKQEKTNCIED